MLYKSYNNKTQSCIEYPLTVRKYKSVYCTTRAIARGHMTLYKRTKEDSGRHYDLTTIAQFPNDITQARAYTRPLHVCLAAIYFWKQWPNQKLRYYTRGH